MMRVRQTLHHHGLRRTAAAVLLWACAGWAQAQGPGTAQPADAQDLPQLGADWRTENPFRRHDGAIRVGASAYHQNCARCHGLEAVAGSAAPDLRKLDNECVSLRDDKRKTACVKDIDEYFSSTVRRGRSRHGVVHMPPFDGVLSQEAVWAIRAYLETRREKSL